MDTKIIAVIVAVVVVAAGAATFFVLNKDDDEAEFNDGAYSLISRVNSEGSGLYIESSIIDNTGDVPTRNATAFYKKESDGSYTVSSANAAAWGGLVFGTPGTSSIQHVQLATLVSEMGMKFQLYQAGVSKQANIVYYNAGITNAALATADDAHIDGGILWEPQYSKIISESSFTGLALTNNLFPGHTCCVVAASHDYLVDNHDATVAFLAGYVKGVDFINKAMADKTSEDYAWLVNFAKTKTAGLTDAEIELALSTITYLYADDANGSLGGLQDAVKDLVAGLKDLSTITGKVKNMDTFLDAYVQDSYLKDAIAGNVNKTTNGKITVAVINGDIHQIAVHIAIEKGYFNEMGISVTPSFAANGAGVAVSVQNGEADLGFLGAPPATITTINAGLISA